MDLTHAVLLAAASGLAGALNSVAGGGTFITFPALLLAGVPAVAANATSTLALWPGTLASAYAYRRDITAPAKLVRVLAITSVLGGGIGAWLLLHTSNEAFEKLIPFLLLFASIVFTSSTWINARLKGWNPSATHKGAVALGAALQFGIAVYGGYFGAGIGILMIAAWSALGFGNIHGVNGLRSILGSTVNGVALILFMLHNSLEWGPAAIMAVTAIVTGYFGAAYARRLPPLLVRRCVLATAWGITGYFFYKFYGSGIL
jgi:uncharacterized membrane protein YfcA